jgi:polysaccharide pyruvyl transferase WcaK-like protein
MMINNSFSTVGMSAAEIVLCRDILAGIHDFQVREPHSFTKLRGAGFPCRLSTDALYLGLKSIAPKSGEIVPRAQIFLSGSVLFTADPAEVKTVIGLQLEELNARFPTDVYEYVALVHGRTEREIFEKTGGFRCIRIVAVSDLSIDKFIELVASSYLVVTGRFHYNMAAAVLGVPFVPLESNNEKIRGLCRELDIDINPIPYKVEALQEFSSNLDRVVRDTEMVITFNYAWSGTILHSGQDF